MRVVRVMRITGGVKNLKNLFLIEKNLVKGVFLCVNGV